MPPLGMHMTVARSLAAQLQHRAVESSPGAYYLGSTTPDIRVLTKWDRARTHFFDLSDFGHQRGVQALFEEHPELATPAYLRQSSVAFLCGYISHLEMDEAWICDIYRPCFGERSSLKGDVLANLLDRVLQFELDKRERADGEAVKAIHCDLINSTVEETIGFLEHETLLRWRTVSAEILEREPDWSRFASRHLRAYGVETDEDFERFMRDVPDMLDQALRQVTPERLQTFQNESRQRALTAIREYLS